MTCFLSNQNAGCKIVGDDCIATEHFRRTQTKYPTKTTVEAFQSSQLQLKVEKIDLFCQQSFAKPFCRWANIKSKKGNAWRLYWNTRYRPHPHSSTVITTTQQQQLVSHCLWLCLPLKIYNLKKHTCPREKHSSILKVAFKLNTERIRVFGLSAVPAVTDAYSQKKKKSIEHAELKNGEMIVAEKHRFMPILPWFHNVSYLFAVIAGGLSDAWHPLPGPFTQQTIHKQKRQSSKCS